MYKTNGKMILLISNKGTNAFVTLCEAWKLPSSEFSVAAFSLVGVSRGKFGNCDNKRRIFCGCTTKYFLSMSLGCKSTRSVEKVIQQTPLMTDQQEQEQSTTNTYNWLYSEGYTTDFQIFDRSQKKKKWIWSQSSSALIFQTPKPTQSSAGGWPQWRW